MPVTVSFLLSLRPLLQELGGQIDGNCTDFEVVPGYGLKCTVGGVERYWAGGKETLPKAATRQLCVRSETSLVPEVQPQGANEPREYKVGGA